MSEKYGLSRRQARRISAMQKGLINNQSSGVAACSRQIISLAGLAAISQYNS
tara:strand:- start:290 stop:445 length:156 start_codon:yes stop_codon:yes gene_type:complete